MNDYLKKLSLTYNLKYFPPTFLKHAKIEGEINRFKVTISGTIFTEDYVSDYIMKKTIYKISIIFKYNTKIPVHLNIIKKLSNRSQKMYNKSRQILSGDKDFDQRFYFNTADQAYLAAILSNEIRSNLLSMIDENCTLKLSNNKLEFIYRREDFEKTILEKYINNISQTLKLITSITDTKSSLIENMLHDPNISVRINCLNIFIKRYKINRDSKITIEKMLNDKDMTIQYEAAQYLGETGMKHLTHMLKNPNILGHELTCNIIKILGNNSYLKSIDMLKTLYNKRDDMAISKEILRAFGSFGDKSLNKFLLEELKCSNSEIRSHTAMALENCGTIDAVESLYKYEKSLLNIFERRKVRGIIKTIQKRCSKGEAGMLSVSEHTSEEGALSLSDKAGKGALSKTKM